MENIDSIESKYGINLFGRTKEQREKTKAKKEAEKAEEDRKAAKEAESKRIQDQAIGPANQDVFNSITDKDLGGGRRRRKSRKTKKSRKSRKSRKHRK